MKGVIATPFFREKGLLLDIKEYLEEKGCEVKDRGVDHISTHCMFCEEETSKAGRLYINVDEYSDKYGLYFCFLCNEKGGLNKLRQYYGDAPLELEQVNIASNPIFEVACKYYEDRLMENPKAYKFLMDDRGFTHDTIKEARFGWADGGLCQHLLQKGYDADDIKSTGLVNQFGEDYFHDEVIIPYLEYGIAIQLRGKKIGGKYRSAQGSKAMLYGTDYILGEDTVTITEGEMCALHLNQIGIPAVGVPGAQTWKKEWTELLEDVKRVYIVYDADKAGKAGAEKVAKELGVKTRIVEIPVAKIDIEDYIVKYDKNYDDIQYLFRKAAGGLLVSVREAYEKWAEIEGNEGLSGLHFNIQALDRAIPLGLLPGQVLTMLARSNSGKTLWTINLFQRMKMSKPDIKILFISLEQMRNEYFHRAYRILNAYQPGASVIDTINYWENNLLLVDRNRITEQDLRDIIDQYAYEMGYIPDLIFVDYLGYYARSFPGTQIEKITQAIMGLKQIAKEYETVVGTPTQANRTNTLGTRLSMDQSKDSSTIEETSDFQISLWRPDQADPNNESIDQEPGVIYQEILKSRGGSTGDISKYLFGPLTLSMVPVDDPAVDRVYFERQCAAAGDSFQQFIHRIKTGDTSI